MVLCAPHLHKTKSTHSVQKKKRKGQGQGYDLGVRSGESHTRDVLF